MGPMCKEAVEVKYMLWCHQSEVGFTTGWAGWGFVLTSCPEVAAVGGVLPGERFLGSASWGGAGGLSVSLLRPQLQQPLFWDTEQASFDVCTPPSAVSVCCWPETRGPNPRGWQCPGPALVFMGHSPCTPGAGPAPHPCRAPRDGHASLSLWLVLGSWRAACHSLVAADFCLASVETLLLPGMSVPAPGLGAEAAAVCKPAVLSGAPCSAPTGPHPQGGASTLPPSFSSATGGQLPW